MFDLLASEGFESLQAHTMPNKKQKWTYVADVGKVHRGGRLVPKNGMTMTPEEWYFTAAIVVAVVSLAFSIWQKYDTRDAMKKLAKVIVSYEKTIESFERQLKSAQPVNQELELRRLALEERKQAWKEIEGGGSAVWTVYQELTKDEN